MIKLDSNIVRNSMTAYRTVDNEGLIMNPEDSMLHSLDKVGCFIWENIIETNKVSSLIEAVKEKFECSDKNVENEVIDFLCKLHDQSLIIVS